VAFTTRIACNWTKLSERPASTRKLQKIDDLKADSSKTSNEDLLGADVDSLIPAALED